MLRGRKVAQGVRAIVVPGSSSVRTQAEAEGLDRIFNSAGFEWRQAGCSMCVAMNDDHLSAGDRCASSTNRNFESRQGQGARTHLMSPAMVAAAAVTGTLPVGNGGTGQTTYTNGQLLIGNTTANTLTKATLTAGSGITITNGTGSITIATSSGSSSSGSNIFLSNNFGGF